MSDESPLGKISAYIDTYTPSLLFPLPRALAREKLKLAQLPFHGSDIWCGYELSWLNRKGKPQLALADFTFPCTSPNIVESKSFKLYLNSFHQTPFSSMEEVQTTLARDLSTAAQGIVSVDLYAPALWKTHLERFSGICLDDLDIETNVYTVDKKLLKTSSRLVEEILYTDLLKSNCLVTGQPDWGSVWMRYVGNQIDHAALLKYFISYRTHNGFAEHCTEQIFCDLLSECAPEKLSVHCRYTRRGGLDINPFRSNFENSPPNMRLIRQ